MDNSQQQTFETGHFLKGEAGTFLKTKIRKRTMSKRRNLEQDDSEKENMKKNKLEKEASDKG